MTKIVLGKRPKSFKRTVTFPMIDGTQGSIECEFKYRTKREYGEFIDRMTRSDKAAEPTQDQSGLQDLLTKTVEINADYLLDVLEGWNLDVKLSRETLQQLADELPAAAHAVMAEYRAVIVEGRLGN